MCTSPECQHEHEHDAHDDHDEHREHDHHEHEHGRSYAEIRALIEAQRPIRFRQKHALGIFHRIAVAEAKIHGTAGRRHRFHEVGALDSIADITLACVGMEELGVEKIFVSALADGHGWIDCAHGRFPIPAPATLEILRGIPSARSTSRSSSSRRPARPSRRSLPRAFGPMPRLKIEKIGYGLGTREIPGRPNVLRAVVGELVEEE